MTGYTKLFNSILASSVWRTNDKTRLVWITLLAMSDKDGIAEGSIPGLADLAHVSLKDCQKALKELSSPDRWSRSEEFEGRRIEPVQGGWRLLNHARYRDKVVREDRREYFRLKQQEHRAKVRAATSQQMSNNVNEALTVKDTSTESPHTDTDTDKYIRAVAAPRDSFRVIRKLAHDVLDSGHFEDEGEFTEALKTACAQRQIPYDSQVVRKAVESVQHTRRRS